MLRLEDAEKLEAQIAKCRGCRPTECDGWKYVVQRSTGELSLTRCERGDNEHIRRMIDDSGVVCSAQALTPELGGLTVVCPQERVWTVEDELEVRRTADALVIGWIRSTGQPGFRYDHRQGGAVWDDIMEARTAPLACFVAWHFRGMSEQVAVAFANCVLSRIEQGLTTVMTCSADPALVLPKWECDRPLLDAMRRPAMLIRTRKG